MRLGSTCAGVLKCRVPGPDHLVGHGYFHSPKGTIVKLSFALAIASLGGHWQGQCEC